MVEEVTQARLVELFSYDEQTGDFVKRSNGKIYSKEDERGYVRIKIDGKRYRAHRLAFLYVMGRMPLAIDHINGIGNDNRWCNLRECDQAQNCRNRGNNIRETKSNIKNVVWDDKTKRWLVVIVMEGKRYEYGTYFDLEIAELVAIGARVKHHGEFARV